MENVDQLKVNSFTVCCLVDISIALCRWEQNKNQTLNSPFAVYSETACVKFCTRLYLFYLQVSFQKYFIAFPHITFGENYGITCLEIHRI